MKRLAALIFVISLPLLAEDEECIFDQDQQLEEYKKLEQRFPGSSYVEDEYRLIIPVEEGQVHLGKGGCVHYGITIELIQPKTDRYKDEEAFFAEVVRLVEQYDNELADAGELKKLLQQKKLENIPDDTGRYYFVTYEGLTAFEIYQRDEADKTLIGVSYYY